MLMVTLLRRVKRLLPPPWRRGILGRVECHRFGISVPASQEVVPFLDTIHHHALVALLVVVHKLGGRFTFVHEDLPHFWVVVVVGVVVVSMSGVVVVDNTRAGTRMVPVRVPVGVRRRRRRGCGGRRRRRR